ncbi:MAG: tetraacyldisaccharide 4'-kinase [Planctomycetes bacterium]|nr:tetraacyldisaccharide 4'-kinase [Planctomycetota bacterium]
MKSIKLWWYNIASGRKLGFFDLVMLTAFWLVSLLYRFILLFRTCLYKCGLVKPVKLAVPVISIGNITVGGTGKTPMTEYLAKYFADKNKKVVVLSRGYGSVGGSGDDEKLSVSSDKVIRLTGPNRAKLGKEAVAKYSPDVILLDDGFQHWRLARNLDIVMIDCLNPFGNWHVFPAGTLREHLNALRRADIFILTHTDLVKDEHLLRMTNLLTALGKPVMKTIHKPVGFISPEGKTVPLADLAHKKSFAFCGIGNPDSFKLTLEKAGLSLAGFTAFPDHYRYTADDISKLYEHAKNSGAECLVTTRKDMVKIPMTNNQSPIIYSLQIELAITEGKEKLEEKLNF